MAVCPKEEVVVVAKLQATVHHAGQGNARPVQRWVIIGLVPWMQRAPARVTLTVMASLASVGLKPQAGGTTPLVLGNMLKFDEQLRMLAKGAVVSLMMMLQTLFASRRTSPTCPASPSRVCSPLWWGYRSLHR